MSVREQVEQRVTVELVDLRNAEGRLARRFRRLPAKEDRTAFLRDLAALKLRAMHVERLLEMLDSGHSPVAA